MEVGDGAGLPILEGEYGVEICFRPALTGFPRKVWLSKCFKAVLASSSDSKFKNHVDPTSREREEGVIEEGRRARISSSVASGGASLITIVLLSRFELVDWRSGGGILD